MRSIGKKGLLLFVSAVVLAVGTVALPRCFTVDLPTCAYVCGPTDPRCPDEYECRSDCYCHLKGSVGSCGFPLDMGCDAGQTTDLARTQDAANPPDLPPADLAGSD